MRYRSAAAALTLLCAGCGLGDAHNLEIGGGPINDVSQTIHSTAHQPHLVGAMPICPQKGTTARVTTVGPLNGDLRVTGFAVRRNPFLSGGEMIGDAVGTLEANGLDRRGGALLSVPCGPGGRIYELIVEIDPGARATAADGFVVTYRSGRRTGHLEIPIRTTSRVAP